MVLIPIKVPEKESKAEELVSPANSLKRRLLGAAVLLALAAIFLPLLLDGSGSESRFRRVENVREYPPKIIGADGLPESTVAQTTEPELVSSSLPEKPPAPPEPVNPPVPKPVVDLKAIAAAKLEELVAKPDQADDEIVIEETIVEEAVRRPGPSADIDAALAKIGEASVDNSNPPQQTVDRVISPSGGTTLAAASVAAAWVVQAGSFVDQENALRLRDNLRDRGFPSFIATAGDREVAQTLRYRVQVGPMTDRLDVEQRQRQIERITGRSALVREYR